MMSFVYAFVGASLAIQALVWTQRGDAGSAAVFWIASGVFFVASEVAEKG